MASWFDNITEELKRSLEQVDELQFASLEQRFSEKLNEILRLSNDGKLAEAKVILGRLKEPVKFSPAFSPHFSPHIDNLYRNTSLTIEIKSLRLDVITKPGKNIKTTLTTLSNIEREAQDFPEILAIVEECKNLLTLTDARRNIQTKNRIFNKLNIRTLLVLAIFSFLTVSPELLGNKEPLGAWFYTLHPEMLGAAITFVLLTVIFEASRNAQDRLRNQIIYYEEFKACPDMVSRQKIIDRMRLEDMLQGAYLVYLNWEGINLKGCNLKDANLSYGKGIDKVICDETTILPNGERFVVGSNLEVAFDLFINPKKKTWMTRVYQIIRARKL